MLIQIFTNDIHRVRPYLGGAQNTLLFLQQGVYLLPSLLSEESLTGVFVLEGDWLASGLAQQAVFKQGSLKEESVIKTLTNAQWAEMIAQHSKVVSVK